MDKSHWARVFKIPYRKHSNTLVREANVKCEIVKSGLVQPGTKTFIDTQTHVTVHVYVNYFDEPKTDEEQDQVDVILGKVLVESDEYVKGNYPNANVTW